MARLLKYLFKKNPIRGRWIFLLASAVLAVIGFLGYEYGAFYLYVVPALVCLLQCFYPTVFVWGLFFAVFAVGSSVYSIYFITDIYRLIMGTTPSILLDTDDSVAFILLLIVLLGTTFALFVIRPRLPSAGDEFRQNDLKET